jgi:hypothetical protein
MKGRVAKGMSTSRAVVLFIIGLLLALLTFPTAFWISAALGYVFGIIALVIGVLLVVKRAGRALPLVLGIVLAVIAVISIAGTAFMHMAFYAVSQSVQGVTKPREVTGSLRQPISVGDWRVTVLGVREGKYLREGNVYYSAKEGRKAVVVSLRVENAGRDVKSVTDLWSFTLTTDAGKSYPKSSADLDVVWDVTEEVKAKAVSVGESILFQSIAPGTYMEGDLVFSVPEKEAPTKLFFKVGIIEPTTVEVSLSRT